MANQKMADTAEKKTENVSFVSHIHRVTKETDIDLSLNLHGSGMADIDTGIGFFDHMLDAFARHGFFDLTVKTKGDLNVDCHHTIEDTGIVLGTAVKEALGDKAGIARYGDMILPMDEAWFSAPLTFPAALTSILTTNSRRSASATSTRKWCRNFSMLCPIQQ